MLNLTFGGSHLGFPIVTKNENVIWYETKKGTHDFFPLHSLNQINLRIKIFLRNYKFV
jgi:hypothetical protein